MRKLARIFLFASLLSFWGCGDDKWDVSLYQQKIEGSSKVLYEYDAWGGRDSHSFGIVLMDSTKEFKVNASQPLPISFFTDIPNKSLIKGIELEKPSNNDSITLEPFTREKTKIDNIAVAIDSYEEYTGYSDAGCILNKYSFETFRETKDSIFFNGIEKIFGNNLQNRTTARFKKGNIKLIADKNGKLFRLEIKDLFKGIADKHKYKKGTAEIIERTFDSPVICIRNYYLFPKSDTYVSEFSDFGIFKPVIKSPVPNNI
ncbi:hypothetical protein [Salegentibacter mishustinae]|uniref:hypothetical protein n=1 Tax=Salegentibacter mishustinae TaxID=270918 RepID=UPI0024917916|nr:hypothetical protein [Salegentibacter mishustinae]